MLATHFAHEKDYTAFFGKELFDRAMTRFQKDAGNSAFITSITEIVSYLDYADSFQLLNAKCAQLPPDVSGCIQHFTSELQLLAAIRNRVMHSRPLDFEDLAVVHDLTQSLLSFNLKLWSHLNETNDELKSNPSFVLGTTIPADSEAIIPHNLPVPDFDETGFVGRKTTVDHLIGLIRGPYPVITVLGEGGLGKTALALKAAYQLLDSQDVPFDCIVWTTAKAATITAQEIVRIDDAITSSLGMFASIAKELAGNQGGDPIDEILDYLKTFRILLVLDNLETVIDSRLSGFLEKLPSGSKVLITSRIGLGEFERRLKLPPLEEREAGQLLRALAKVRQLDNLARAVPDVVKSYCKRMKHNPGYIKWFVSAVQAGSRPEEVLDHSELFLEYCMSHVYMHLSPESKRVLKSMQCVPAPMSQAELAFLNNIPALGLQTSLYQLLATNMVLMTMDGTGLAAETRYNLSELARQYLIKKHPVPPADYMELQGRARELNAAGAYIKAEKDPFSFFSITTRSKGDRVVAKYLFDALKDLQKDAFQQAQESINNARGLAPQYFEVHRVEAWMHAKAGNTPAAEASYEVAIELEPKSAALRFWYGGFLMRYVKDDERAAKQYLEAAALAPNEPQIVLELARVFMGRHSYCEAEQLVAAAIRSVKNNAVLKRKLYDIQIQISHRGASYALAQRDHPKALLLLEKLVEDYDKAPSDVRDAYLCETLKRAAELARVLTGILVEQDFKNRALAVLAVLGEALEKMGVRVTSGQRIRGMIDRVPPGKKYGFIIGEDGREYFFHFGTFGSLVRVDMIKEGDEVSFQVADALSPEEKPRAVMCELVLSL